MNPKVCFVVAMVVAGATAVGSSAEFPLTVLKTRLAHGPGLILSGVGTAIDDAGDRYVSSGVNAPKRIGDRLIIPAVTNTEIQHLFVAKYDKHENLVWLQDAPNAHAGALAAFGTNWIVIAGRIRGETRLGDTAIKPPGTNHGEIFFARLSSDGRFKWVQHLPGTGEGFAYAVAVDSEGSIFLTGELREGNFDFGGTILTGSRGCDGFVAKFDSEGKLLWAYRDAGDFVEPRGIATARDGSVYVTGIFYGKFAGREAQGPEMFLAKYSAAGKRLWVTNPGGGPRRTGFNIACDPEGNPHVVGLIEDTRMFGTITVTQETKAYDNVYLAKYNPEAELQWVRQFRRGDCNFGNAVSLAGAKLLGPKDSSVMRTDRAALIAAAIKVAELTTAIELPLPATNDLSEPDARFGPRLNIFKQGKQLLIVWPEQQGNFVLESTEAILPLAIWTPINAEQTRANGFVIAIVAADSVGKFYRLRNP